jgi:phosphate/sulfate permease
MTPVEFLAYASIVFLFLQVMAAGANDAASGLGGIWAAASATRKSALLLGMIVGVLGLLTVAPQLVQPWFERLFDPAATESANQLAAALFAAIVASALVTGGVTLLKFPVPPFLIGAAALTGAGFIATIGSGSTGGRWLPLFALIAIVVLIVLLALGLAIVSLRLIQRFVLGARRPRDRAVASIAAFAATAVFFAAIAFSAQAAGASLVLGLAVGLGLAALAGGAGYWLALRVRPDTENSAEGADALHGRVQMIGGLLALSATGTAQALAAGFPAALLLALSGAVASGQAAPTVTWADTAIAQNPVLVLTILAGYGAGVLFLGHLTAEFLGDRLAPTGPAGGTAANLAVLVLGGATLPLGLPAFGGQSATGALTGVALFSGEAARERLREPLLALSGAWAAALIGAPILAMIIYGVCAVLMP